MYQFLFEGQSNQSLCGKVELQVMIQDLKKKNTLYNAVYAVVNFLLNCNFFSICFYQLDLSLLIHFTLKNKNMHVLLLSVR